MGREKQQFAVIGDPIAHSRSPQLHLAAFRAMGLVHHYEARRVTAAELGATVDLLKTGTLSGLNVTLPHKVAVMALADVVTETAQVVGAANTLFRNVDGQVVAANTDVEGLVADLRRVGVTPHNALVFGAGGAARAAIVALGQLGAQVTILARNEEQAQRMARELAAKVWDGREVPFDFILNATSAGMSGGPDGTTVAACFASVPKTPNAVAYDVVYQPRVTPMLAIAAAQGHPAHDGLGMLVEQALAAERYFLGQEPTPAAREAMWRIAQT